MEFCRSWPHYIEGWAGPNCSLLLWPELGRLSSPSDRHFSPPPLFYIRKFLNDNRLTSKITQRLVEGWGSAEHTVYCIHVHGSQCQFLNRSYIAVHDQWHLRLAVIFIWHTKLRTSAKMRSATVIVSPIQMQKLILHFTFYILQD